MTERLSSTELEIIRRSLVMSPTLPAPTAESLLTEIQRLREQLVMLTPGRQALTREDALRLVEELAQVQVQLDVCGEVCVVSSKMSEARS